jgi:hypothetical protein
MSLRPGDRFQSMEDFKAVLTGSATVTAMMRAYVPAKGAAKDPAAIVAAPVVVQAPWLQSPAEAPTVAMSAAGFAPPPSPPPSFSTPPSPPAGFAPPPPPPPSFSPPPPSYAPIPPQAPPQPPASGGKQRWLIPVAIAAIALIATGLVLARHRVFPRLFPTPPAPIVAATDPNAPAAPAPDPNAATPPAPDPNAATPPDPNAPPNPDPNQPVPNNPQNQPDAAAPPAPAQPAPDAAPAGPDYDTLVGQAVAAGDFTVMQTQLLLVMKQFPKKPRAYAELAELELYSLNDLASAAPHAQAAIARGGEAVFHIRHDHSGETFASQCTGKLYVSKSKVRFVPVSGPHGFSVKKDEIKEVKKNKMSGGFGFGRSDVRAFHIRLPTQNYNLAGSSQSIDAERDLILASIGEH